MAGPEKISLDPDSPAYDTADEAASALADKFKSDERAVFEKAGVLYKGEDGKFRYSTAIQGENDQFALAAQVPKGHTLAGIVHSHPGKDEEGRVFSTNDLTTADKLKLPSYVRFLNDGATRVYTPGKTQTHRMRTSASYTGVKVAKGDPLQAVLAQLAAPTEPKKLEPAVESALLADMKGIKQ